jgi:hypothetical protein
MHAVEGVAVGHADPPIGVFVAEGGVFAVSLDGVQEHLGNSLRGHVVPDSVRGGREAR